MKVQKDLDNLHGRSFELDELDEKIQHVDRKLQELVGERVHLRERSTMLQAKVKGLEDEIKRDFLCCKLVVIEEHELDYIDKIGAYYWAIQDDIQMVGSLRVEEVNVCQLGALE